jgi:hypothetical protein|tara:strand:+ start:611 stop:1273 length:663 start_codon:yes stop_codon:yes gene_type:complete
MTTNIDAIKNRRQIKYFTDKIPDKVIIKEILSDTVKYAPVKNNMWNFKLEVYGPEWAEEKQKMVLNTICTTPLFPLPEDSVSTVYKAYKEQGIKNGYGLKYDKNIHRFNDQVTAPYLIAIKLSKNTYNLQNESQDVLDVAVMAGCIGATLSYLTQEKNLGGGFCQCFMGSDKLGLEKNFIANEKSDFLFTYSIGYPDKNLYVRDPWPLKPNVNDVVEWMT